MQGPQVTNRREIDRFIYVDSPSVLSLDLIAGFSYLIDGQQLPRQGGPTGGRIARGASVNVESFVLRLELDHGKANTG